MSEIQISVDEKSDIKKSEENVNKSITSKKESVNGSVQHGESIKSENELEGYEYDISEKPSIEEFVVGKRSLRFKALYDPGLEEAINYVPEPPPEYASDGVQNYLDLTKALEIPVVKRFKDSLTKSSIALQYYGLQLRQMRAMADALLKNTSVEEVNLAENILDLDSMYHLGQMLRKNVHIRSLNLSGCMIGTEGAEMLGSGLDVCQYLEYLDLSRNDLGDDGFEVIAPSFGYNLSVQTLILSHNNLTHKSGFALAEMLEENTGLQSLDLSWNKIYDEPGIKKFLAVTASQNTTLIKLNMSWNGLQGDKIAFFFRQFLAKHKGIRVLDISNNRFEGSGAMAKFAKGISLSETLQELNLGFNPIKEDEAYYLLSGISSICPLRVLNLEYVWVNKQFNQLRKQAEQNRGLRIIVGGVFEGKEIKGPDMQKCLLQRAQYLAQKPKKKKNKKDFGWFLLRLRDANKLKPVKKSKFEEMVIEDKIKFEDGLVDNLAKRFRNEKKRIDLPRMLDVYLELFPNAQLPRSKSRKKKGKKDVQLVVGVEQVVEQIAAVGGIAKLSTVVEALTESELPSELGPPTESEIPSESGQPTESEPLTESNLPSEFGAPTESEPLTESNLPSEFGPPTESETASEFEPQTESEIPSEAGQPTESEIPSEAGQPTESEIPSEAGPPTESELPYESNPPTEFEVPSESEP